MESSLQNIILETKPFSEKKLIRLKANTDFPFDTPKDFRIIRGQPSRTMFEGGRPVCATEDCVTGYSTDGKKQECSSCEHKTSGACAYKCLIYLEHNDPSKEYVLAIPYAAQYALSEYIKSLLMDEVDAPDVITRITRVATDDGRSTYNFELANEIDDVDEDEIELTADESLAINELIAQLRSRDLAMDIAEFAETLKYVDEFIGINDERAEKIAKSIAKDGLIR
ncbi:MAG: hypothetical protein PHT13_00915 [Methanosarcina sp.]|jgi:hypothetical protein|nr:hypothetical protein [Methanosarcina sp.]